jgi:hypothetical protein
MTAFLAKVLPSVITGGASLLGSHLSNNSASSAQAEANRINYEIAKENREFQKESLQNFHQWEVNDLRKAGLNPVLSAGGGSSSLPGSVAHMESTKKDSLNIGLATARLISDITKVNAEKKVLQAQAKTEEAVAKIQQQVADIQTSKPGKALNWLKYAMGSGVGSFLGAFGGISSASKIAKALSAGAKFNKNYRIGRSIG